MGSKLLTADVAAGTAYTTSTTETVLASEDFPANYFQTGKVVRFYCSLNTTAQNSTDTLIINVRLGPTTLTGTVLAVTTAVDQVADDHSVITGILACRSGSGSTSGTIISQVMYCDADASGEPVLAEGDEVASLDLTAIQRLEVTGTWSVSSASNSVRSELWIVEELT